MREITPDVRDKWISIIFDILNKFISICKQHNLTYFCCGGTAIGAVRDGKMIPWDDDIDVFMPRPDYDKFIEITKSMDLEGYEIISPYTNKKYPLYFIKMCNRNTTLMEDKNIPCISGLYIDIFPIDGASDDYSTACAMVKRFVKIKNKLEAISTHVSFYDYIKLILDPKEWGRFARKTLGFFFRETYRTHLLNQLDSISRKYSFINSKNVAVYCGSYGLKEIFPKQWVEGSVLFTFNGLSVCLPVGYHHYLKQYYGDYMELPPLEKRVSHHSKAYFNLEEREHDEVVIYKAKHCSGDSDTM